jgi:small subunit ribosomal protein S4
MARNLEPSCKQCRREGVKLFLKGEKCQGGKCTMIKRNYIPGQHGLNRRRGKASDYSLQLREKQEVKRIYGLLEKQFSNYFEKADHKEGVTGEILLQLLETRLDNVVYRIGFGSSRKEARQMVNHGHFKVNGKKVNIPSYQVKPNDEVSLTKEGAKQKGLVSKLEENMKIAVIPAWIKQDPKKFTGELVYIPAREELDPEINEQLIVELYSK